jgi:hypothetical protein
LGIHLGGAQVHILVQGETQLEQQAALNDSRGNVGVVGLTAHGTEQNRIVRGNGGKVGVAQYVARGQIAVGSQ